MAVPQHQHRLRREIQRERRDSRIILGSSRPQSSDDHFDARASWVSLPRWHLQQSDRALQAPGRRSELRAVREALGAAIVFGVLRDFAQSFLGRGEATLTVPSFDGALKPNQALERAEILLECDAPEDLAT